MTSFNLTEKHLSQNPTLKLLANSGYRVLTPEQAIGELQGDSEELLKKLLGNTIDAISYNASVTLDKKHGDTPPLQKIIDVAKPDKN